jgi:tRNA(adenine34) deaminase
MPDLRAPWDDVFDLMWEAYSAGTIPVGAVLADATGTIVARGRNRIFDEAGDRQLGRSRLAHAEMNAMLQLPSGATYEDVTLYSALEPCHLCLAAAIAVRLGTVLYAAADPYGGAVGKLTPSEDHRAHPVVVEGPLAGTTGLLPELLHVAHFLWRVPNGGVATFYRTTHPELVDLARRLPDPDDGATLTEAFAALS